MTDWLTDIIARHKTVHRGCVLFRYGKIRYKDVSKVSSSIIETQHPFRITTGIVERMEYKAIKQKVKGLNPCWTINIYFIQHSYYIACNTDSLSCWPDGQTGNKQRTAMWSKQDCNIDFHGGCQCSNQRLPDRADLRLTRLTDSELK